MGVVAVATVSQADQLLALRQRASNRLEWFGGCDQPPCVDPLEISGNVRGRSAERNTSYTRSALLGSIAAPRRFTKLSNTYWSLEVEGITNSWRMTFGTAYPTTSGASRSRMSAA